MLRNLYQCLNLNFYFQHFRVNRYPLDREIKKRCFFFPLLQINNKIQHRISKGDSESTIVMSPLKTFRKGKLEGVYWNRWSRALSGSQRLKNWNVKGLGATKKGARAYALCRVPRDRRTGKMIPREVISCLMARATQVLISGWKRRLRPQGRRSSTSFKLWETFPRGAGVWLSVVSEMQVVAKARRLSSQPGTLGILTVRASLEL